jgi:hypothetical protein
MGIHRQTVADRINTLERRLALLERVLTAAPAGGYNRIQADGVDMPPRTIINFVGAAVTDNPAEGRTDVE